MKCCTFYLIFTLLFGAAALSTAQEKQQKKGKLGEFVEDYEKKKKDGEDKKKDKEAQENSSDDSGDGGWLSFLLDIFFSIGGADEGSDSATHVPKPAPYPYREGNGLPITSPDYRSYSILAEVGYLHLADDIRGVQLAGDLRAYRFAAAADLHTLVEEVGGDDESLTFLGLNAGYEVMATPYLLARPYLGARNLSGLGIAYWGPEVGAKLLMLPRKPINVEMNLAHARINSKPLTIINGSIGVMLNRFEVRFGGQFFRSEWTALEGVRIGVRLWL